VRLRKPGSVLQTRPCSQWPLLRVLAALGLKRSVYFSWKAKLNSLADGRRKQKQLYRILPEEETAIVEYAKVHPAEGYRRLCWMMVDEDVACVSPGSVYNVLDKHDLLYRWKRPEASLTKVEPPTAPNQRWHTDIMYLWLSGRWYFFVGVIDAYSRYVVHWELLTSMQAEQITLVVQLALEKYPGVCPVIVNDNGSQFTGKEFKKLIKRFQLRQIRTRVHHPESNGVIERFHRSLREELSEKDLKNLSLAREIIGQWVDYYNHQRLHGGLKYLRPANYHFGNPDQLIEIRKTKLAKARQLRKIKNIERLNEANRSNLQPLKSPICA
jgi:putative transposase